ncbi:hypothetical protein MKW94_001601, partial [Papaver nudicaule]|nr:hypothetical protein [Papaver nudicaule]
HTFTLYVDFQVGRHVHHISIAIYLFDQRTTGLVDFFGDQIVAYLLISSASAAVPHTNCLRENANSIFTDKAAASINMAFFAFFSLAVSAMILSGYKLFVQNYIGKVIEDSIIVQFLFFSLYRSQSY